MSTLDQIHHGLQHALESLAEGWHALRQRAAHAVTRFSPCGGAGGGNGPERALLHGASRWGLLAAEVREDEEQVVVTLEAPGMRAEDFDLQVVDDLLVVRGEKRMETEEAFGGRYFLLERAYGAFERAIHLPAEVDQHRAKAHYRCGVLSIALPKRNRIRSRRVPVGAS